MVGANSLDCPVSGWHVDWCALVSLQVEYYPDEVNGELGQDMVSETEYEGLDGVVGQGVSTLHLYIPRS